MNRGFLMIKSRFRMRVKSGGRDEQLYKSFDFDVSRYLLGVFRCRIAFCND